MIPGRILAILAIAATLSAWIAVPMGIYRSGSGAVPGFQAMVVPGALSAKHAFLAENCEACHTPNRGIVAGSCIVCHADNTTLLARQTTSFHATIGDCRGCHVEHLGITRRLTSMQHDALVDIAERQLAQTASVFVKIGDALPAMASLFHGATERSGMLDCVACHANKDRHRTLFGQTCGDCHSTEKWTIAEFRHPSPRSTDCVQCHQAPPSHYMEHFRMVSMVVARQMHAQVDQCFLCHQITAWNDIKGVGWYKHH